jgi:hypothetical protein
MLLGLVLKATRDSNNVTAMDLLQGVKPGG